MTRRRTYRRTCSHTGCPESSLVEYTARRDLETVSPTWTCFRHSRPNEVLSADNPETTVTLELHPKYINGYRQGEPPRLLGLYWGPAGQPDKANAGIQSGPGFRAVGDDFPPGTRLVVTARIELPDMTPEA